MIRVRICTSDAGATAVDAHHDFPGADTVMQSSAVPGLHLSGNRVYQELAAALMPKLP